MSSPRVLAFTISYIRPKLPLHSTTSKAMAVGTPRIIDCCALSRSSCASSSVTFLGNIFTTVSSSYLYVTFPALAPITGHPSRDICFAAFLTIMIWLKPVTSNTSYTSAETLFTDICASCFLSFIRILSPALEIYSSPEASISIAPKGYCSLSEKISFSTSAALADSIRPASTIVKMSLLNVPLTIFTPFSDHFTSLV